MLAALETLTDAAPAPVRVGPADVEALEGALLSDPLPACPVVDLFAPGIYARECTLPAGSICIGHEHTTTHLNIVLTGRARVLVGNEVKTIKAGDVFTSGPGTRKVGLIEETMRFLTIHPNPSDETDPAKLEAGLIRKSETFLSHEEKRALAAASQEGAR